MGSFLIDNKDWIAELISGILKDYSIEALQTTLAWLMVRFAPHSISPFTQDSRTIRRV
jgi:hypothetical protein